MSVAWGDCDPAGIVFFPNYLRWMDESALHLFDTIGLGWKTLRQQYNAPGLPLARMQTDFIYPATFGDSLKIVSVISRVRSRSISLRHEVRNADQIIVIGSEERVWSTGGPIVEGKIKPSRFPDDILSLLRASCVDAEERDDDG